MEIRFGMRKSSGLNPKLLYIFFGKQVKQSITALALQSKPKAVRRSHVDEEGDH